MTANTRGGFGRVAATAVAGAAVAGAAWLADRHHKVQTVPADLRHPLLYVPLEFNAASLNTIRGATRGSSVPLSVRRSTRTVPVSGRQVTLYEPRSGRTSPAVVLYLHGGGFVVGGVDGHHARCSEIAQRLGGLVVSVDYRLAPEHPFPAPFDDATAALTWVRNEADNLHIDPTRLVVAGDSAGGGLAASLTQWATDQGIPVAGQVLLYPMLDDRTVLRDHHPDRGQFLWTPSSNRFGWSSYLGHAPSDAGTPPYAVAARRVDLAGLPPAWIGVGERDLLYDEDLRYAERLREAGVPVELVTEPGMYHGADAIVTDGTREFTQSWLAFIERTIGEPQDS